MWKKLEATIRSECAKVGGILDSFSVDADRKGSAVIELGTRMVSIEVLDTYTYDCFVIEMATEQLVFSTTRELANFEQLEEAIRSDLARGSTVTIQGAEDL